MRLPTRRGAALFAAALCSLAVFSTAASADPITQTIGPADLSSTYGSWSGLNTVDANMTDESGAAIEVPSDGRITSWRAHFHCFSGCDKARLLVLRPGVADNAWIIVDSSAAETATAGVQEFSTDLKVKAHDRLGLELVGTRVRYTDTEVTGPDATRWTTTDPISGEEVVFAALPTRELGLYNAEFLPKPSTTTTVAATPDPVVASGSVKYSVAVAGGTSPYPTGDVAVTADGTPVPGCTAVTLVDGEGECTATAPSVPGDVTIEATYSGDDEYLASSGTTGLHVLDESTVTAAVNPDPVARNAAVTYTAAVTGSVQSSGVSVMSEDFGTVAFSVDGDAIAACAAQPVDEHGVATCTTTAPAAGGPHTLVTDFGGNHSLSSGTDSEPFTVLVPAVSVPASSDFGKVLTAGQVTKTIALTNTGGAVLNVEDATIDGSSAFAVVASDCVAVAASASCSVDVTFTPATIGAHTATLVFDEDSGTGVHGVALTGTGILPLAPPVDPTPTPTPEPPAPTPAPEPPAPTPTPTPPAKPPVQPGGKLVATTSSGKSVTPSLTATAPAAGVTSRVSLPLTCPAEQTCGLSGRLEITTSAFGKAAARASAAGTKVVARFDAVQIKAGKLKTIKLKLSPSFVKAAQKQGIRRIKATLTINTVFGSGERATTRQRVVVVLPKAAKRAAAPRFTG